MVKHIICELTGYRPGSVDVSQGDRQSRAVSCRLLESGAPWVIPEGATARVAYTLPDGTEGLYDRRPDGTPMWEISKNIVTVELADQLMAQAGMVQMSILIIGPEGGQLATWPIRVMVTANKAAGLTVPESLPTYGAGFVGKIFFGGEDGTVTPLGIGDGVEIVLQEDGTFALVASGGSGGGGGITEEKDPTVPAWARQPNKPTYTAQEVGALPAGTKIPGKTSELTNDAGFVDKAVSDLANYYTKAQTQELIAAIPRFRVTVVQQLPAAGEDLVLYLVPFATAEGQYLEYIWVDGRWEIIGSQRVDLSGYATEEWVQDNYQPKGEYLTEVPDGYAKTEDIPTRPEDIGAQPKGNYASPDDIPKVPNWAMQASKPAYTASEVGALPNTYTPPNQTAEQVGADPKGTAASAVSAHNTNNAAHNDIRLLIEGLANRLNAALNSTDTDLDQMAEIVAYIKANKGLIDGITTSKVSVSDIINNLTTNVANKPLSAAQGVAIKALIDGLSTGKLDASKLSEAINTALAQAKASGEFDGEDGADGQRGLSLLSVTTAPSSYTTAVGGITPKYRMAISTIKSQAGVSEVLLGDTVRYSYYQYPVDYLDASYAYFTTRVSLRGTAGAAATFEITEVEELAYGADPTVTETSDSTAQARKYVVGIPAGKPGDPYELTPADKAEIVAMVIESLGGDPVFGYVDSDTMTIVLKNAPDGEYSLAYLKEDGTISAPIGSMVKDTNVYYSVTSSLTNCTSSNSATQVAEGESYSATITAKSGYTLSSVKVTMGGTDISSTAVSGGTITIANVTGNIVITATATEVVASYTNLANPASSDWWADSYLSSSGEQRTGKTGYAVSNFIGPVSAGDVIYVKGIDLSGTTAEFRCAPYKTDKTLHGSFGTGAIPSLAALSTAPITNATVSTTGGQFTNNKSDIKYWRIGGKLNGTANDVIITINEPID